MTYARSSAVPKDCNLGRIAAPSPKRGIAVHARTHARFGSVPRVAVGPLSQSVQALSLFVWSAPPVVTARQSD